MKLKSARFILVSGLAVAINLSGSVGVNAAGKAKPKALRLAQAPLDLNTIPVPNTQTTPTTPGTAPTWSPTPLDPNAAPPVVPDPPAPSPATAPDPGAVITAPMPMGTKPNVAPPDRPPLGFHYGEQERLEMLKNPKAFRRPQQPMQTPPPAVANPQSPLPLNSNGVVLTPVPDSGGAPGEIDVPVNQPIGTDRFGVAPPPGTLGQTYKRRSRVIEDTKHPRVGAVEVALPEEVDVTGEGLKVKWTGKVWRLESEPLLPGIPHIYEIKASWGEGTEPQVRTIRLIMGRIVDLEF